MPRIRHRPGQPLPDPSTEIVELTRRPAGFDHDLDGGDDRFCAAARQEHEIG
jgi:hypothetical protein